MFTNAAALAEDACRLRESKIAYVKPQPGVKP
jgi:hypothetical protein